MKYRKKPIIIEAYQTDKELDIETLEGTMHASVGDYIITGVRGEQYPCKPDIFEQTYEPADAPAASPWHRVKEDPKKEKRYLVWDVDGFAYCDTWKEGKWQVASTVPGTHITHWMPIEPPKEDA